MPLKEMQDWDDHQLVEVYIRNGDMSAIGVLYKRYLPLVHGLCLKYFQNYAEAEDASMEIFELLLQKLKTHEVIQFKSWLYVVSKNYCFEQLRKANRSLTKKEEANLMYSEQIFHPDDIEDKKMGMDLKRCLDGLVEEQSRCIRLFYFEKMSYTEISMAVNLDKDHVRSHLQNGRRNLKNCMQDGK